MVGETRNAHRILANRGKCLLYSVEGDGETAFRRILKKTGYENGR
jgi:hypothetical protein